MGGQTKGLKMRWEYKRPNKIGYYWYKENRGVTICEVYDSLGNGPDTVSWVGSDWDTNLKDTKGKWGDLILFPK